MKAEELFLPFSPPHPFACLRFMFLGGAAKMNSLCTEHTRGNPSLGMLSTVSQSREEATRSLPHQTAPRCGLLVLQYILLSGCIQQLLLEVAKTSCSIEKKCPTNSDGAEPNLVEFLGTLFSRPLRSKVGLWGKSCVCVPLIYAIQEVLIAELILHLMSTASCTANSL